MKANHRLVLVGTCLLCLLAVATMLPAADPRIDSDTTESGSGNSWDTLVEEDRPNQTVDPDAPPGESEIEEVEEVDDGGEGGGPEPHLAIEGTIAPGNRVEIRTSVPDPTRSYTLELDGTDVGSVEDGSETPVRVPFNESMTVSIPEADYVETIDIPTSASIDSDDPPVPGYRYEVTVTVENVRIPDAAVYQDGERVGTTDENGTAMVALPATAGETDLAVERGPVSGTKSVEVQAPEITFQSGLLFPGFPAPVSVTAGGQPVPDAVVVVNGERRGTTDESGQATIRLPISDTVTISTTLGNERSQSTATNLYFRLAAVLVFVPGILIGLFWTYLRLELAYHRYWWRRSERLFVTLGKVTGVVARGTRRWVARIRRAPGRLRRPSWPSLLPAGRFRGEPGLGSISLPRLNLPSLSFSLGALPSFDGLLDVFDRSEPRGSRTEASDESPTGRRTQEETMTPDGPTDDEDSEDTVARTQIRAAWHTFCDRLDVRKRETKTPGQVARTAIAAGFPVATIRRLVRIFRTVEYGGVSPTDEQVAEATAAADELDDFTPEEDSS